MINTLENKQFGPNKTFRDKVFDYSCHKIGKDRTKFFFKLYDLTRFDLFGKPKGAIGAIDITNRCNLRCKHCYFYAHDYEENPTNQKARPINRKPCAISLLKGTGLSPYIP